MGIKEVGQGEGFTVWMGVRLIEAVCTFTSQ